MSPLTLLGTNFTAVMVQFQIRYGDIVCSRAATISKRNENETKLPMQVVEVFCVKPGPHLHVKLPGGLKPSHLPLLIRHDLPSSRRHSLMSARHHDNHCYDNRHRDSGYWRRDGQEFIHSWSEFVVYCWNSFATKCRHMPAYSTKEQCYWKTDSEIGKQQKTTDTCKT